MGIEYINVESAPRAVGPYCHAVRAGDFLHVSGQIALDPDSGDLVGETSAEQARQVLRNLKAVIEGAGGRLDQVVKTTIYLAEMETFPQVNEVYDEFFGGNTPARSTVGVAALPKGALVEMDAVCYLGG